MLRVLAVLRLTVLAWLGRLTVLARLAVGTRVVFGRSLVRLLRVPLRRLLTVLRVLLLGIGGRLPRRGSLVGCCQAGVSPPGVSGCGQAGAAGAGCSEPGAG